VTREEQSVLHKPLKFSSIITSQSRTFGDPATTKNTNKMEATVSSVLLVPVYQSKQSLTGEAGSFGNAYNLYSGGPRDSVYSE
jgi:hypothetical protein